MRRVLLDGGGQGGLERRAARELDRLAGRHGLLEVAARDPRLDAERVGAGERQRVRAAVGLPGARASGTASRSKPSRKVRPRRGFSTATVPSSRSVRKTSSWRAGLGARHLAQVDAPAVAQAARAATARAGRARGAPCPPRPRAASRSCAPARAAGSRPRGTARRRRSGGPRRGGARRRDVLDALVQRQRRRAALEQHAALERERRERAAHAADQLDRLAALAATSTLPGQRSRPRRGTAARRRGRCRRRCSSAAAPASRRRSCAGTPCRPQPSRGGAPGGCRPQGDLNSTSTPVERSRNS